LDSLEALYKLLIYSLFSILGELVDNLEKFKSQVTLQYTTMIPSPSHSLNFYRMTTFYLLSPSPLTDPIHHPNSPNLCLPSTKLQHPNHLSFPPTKHQSLILTVQL